MKRADFEREPCPCAECEQAGVSDRVQVRDPQTGAFLHGYPLRRWHEAADRCLADVRKLAGEREPGCDDE